MATPAERVVAESWVLWAQNAIDKSQEDYTKYEDYYIGDHPLVFATTKWEDTFGTVFEEFSDNWCQVVVDAVVQRMEITGWRSEDSKEDAKQAEAVWDDNNLEVEEDDLHTQTLVKGDGYLMVQQDPENEGKAQIFYNDALHVAVNYDPTNRRRIIRAAKRFREDDGTRWLYIYFRDRTEKWVIPSSAPTGQLNAVQMGFESVPTGWKSDGSIPNVWDTVPVFHFKNRAIGSDSGLSELKSVIPVQNGVNKLLMDLMVGSEFGSFRQKWIAGGGQPKTGWRAGAERIWATTDPNAKFGEFGQVDLEPLVRAIDLVVGHVAKITQTPLHYLRASGDMPSGEALKASESGLVKKCIARQKAWGAVWGQAMSLALQIENGTKPKQPLRPVWKSAETRHDLEQAQTAQLKSILGIPLEILWAEHFNYSEEQIAQFKQVNQDIAAQAINNAIAQSGQVPPGAEMASAQGLTLPQVLALLPKSQTSQTTAGEATTKPQPNSRPPGSPTRRSSGFKD